MKLDKLKNIGAFISDKDIQKIPVKWVRNNNGCRESFNFEVYLKKMSFEFFNKINSLESINKTALMISELIRFGENGCEQLTYQDALDLEASLALAIDEAVNKHIRKEAVNG